MMSSWLLHAFLAAAAKAATATAAAAAAQLWNLVSPVCNAERDTITNAFLMAVCLFHILDSSHL